MPSSSFPEFYYLAIFKSKSNKLDFIPLYTLKILINGGVINISKTLLHFYQEKTNSVGNKNIFTWRKKKFLFLRKNLQTIFHSLKFNKRGGPNSSGGSEEDGKLISVPLRLLGT